MTEVEADRRAKELNLELGAAGESHAYYMPVQQANGAWEVERQRPKPSLKGRLVEFVIDWFPP